MSVPGSTQNGRLAVSQKRLLTRLPSWSLPVAVGFGLSPMRLAQVALRFSPALPCQASVKPAPLRL